MKYTLSLGIVILIALAAIFLPGPDARKNKPFRLPLFSNPRFLNIVMLLLFAAGAAVRLYAFGRIPAGVFIDEAIIGYDSYSILHYGIDHNGFSYPIHLASFGGGQHALYAYLSMPFIAALGLNRISIRLVNLIFGLVSLGIFYLLVLRTDGRKTALAALFLLAINPWHIMISRWGLECNLFPAVFLLATYFLVRWLQGGRTLVVSMLLYGLSLYAYGTAYAVVPVFLLGMGIYLRLHRRLRVRDLLKAGAVLGLTALPIVLYVAVNKLGLNTIHLGPFTIPRLPAEARFSQVFSLFSGAKFFKAVADNAAVLGRLFTDQLDKNLWNALPGFGYMYLFGLPLILSGMWAAIRERRTGPEFRTGAVHLIWLSSAVVLGLLISVNINRINILFLPLIYLAARALVFIAERSRILAGVLVLLLLAWFGLFCNAYFNIYPDKLGAAFNESLGEAVQDASTRTDETVYITRNLHLPYAYVLFYEHPSPYDFMESAVYEDTRVEFRDVTSFGRYRFVKPADMPAGAGVYVIGNRDLGEIDTTGYSIVPYKLFSVLIPQ